MRKSRTSGSIEGSNLRKLRVLDSAKKYKLYKSSIKKFTFCAEESEQQHERAACYCSAQFIKGTSSACYRQKQKMIDPI